MRSFPLQQDWSVCFRHKQEHCSKNEAGPNESNLPQNEKRSPLLIRDTYPFCPAPANDALRRCLPDEAAQNRTQNWAPECGVCEHGKDSRPFGSCPHVGNTAAGTNQRRSAEYTRKKAECQLSANVWGLCGG